MRLLDIQVELIAHQQQLVLQVQQFQKQLTE
jgi:hypothetical protein